MRPGVRGSIALALAMFVAACGTRLPDEAFAPREELVADRAADPLVPAAPGDPGQPDGAGEGPDGPTDTVATTSPPAADGSSAPPGPSDEGAPAPNEASDTGVTADTIRLGNITAENGVLGDTFAPAVRGLRAWVQNTNANGGIHGRRIELFTCDDREDRSRALECARRLVEQEQVFALVATNTRALGGASQYLADQGVPVIGFPINNAFYRYPNFFTIYGTGYARDGSAVGLGGSLVSLSGQFRWFRENLGVTKAAVFYYDISESSQAGRTFVDGLQAEGYSVKEFVVSFAAPSFDQAVAEMLRDGTQLIYDAMDDGANRRLCDAMERREFVPEAKVSTVVILGAGTGDNYDEACRNVMYAPTESRVYTADDPEVTEFRSAYARYQPGLPLHQWALEAWATGNIAEDALASMGPSPTRAGFIEFLDTMSPNTGGGIMVGTGFQRSQVSDGDRAEDCFGIARWQDSTGGWAMASSPFPFCYPDAIASSSPASEQGN